MNRQDAKENQIKKANGNRKDAEAAKERKEKPKQNFFAAFLCAFAPLRLSLLFLLSLAFLASWQFNNQP